ncbi:hypothetical protein [Sphingobium sufflavum]|uniref:hypothetical protein n=1 Tax=Sphingobium sufflavum TaxID=1129547 RepID=UPI001F23F34F|nr:hypothetical protein [Sphingobium sufflavum]
MIAALAGKEDAMDAPLYHPAAAYAVPTILPYQIGTRTCTIGELKGLAAAWPIVLKHMPAVQYIVQAPGFEKQLDNMTLADLAVFSAQDNSATLDAIDDDLARLFPNKGRAR